MSSIAIIPARGGSKRIPKKNIRDFCGKPIIAYSIEAALGSGIFDVVMVSTDSQEIADIAIQYGAEVPFLRSKKNSDDYATTNDVLIEVLNEYEKRDCEFDLLACIYPTAPYITEEALVNAVKEMARNNADAVMPVVKYSFPPQRAVIIEDGKLKYQYPENMLKRSQDLQPVYHDCGQFYVCNVNQFKQYGQLFAKNTVPLIMEESLVQDIDTLSDWKQAEMKYKMWRGID